jgi:hypothetical protein
MQNAEYFLDRLMVSLAKQTFQDYELIITKEGKMAENTNAAIKKAKGEIVKLLYMDDFFYSPDALKHIHENFKGGWMASGCVHTTDGSEFFNPHYPSYNQDIGKGVNTIGSPSVVAFANEDPLLFDENLSWLLDCELYERLYARYGDPTILPYLDIGMGLGEHQTTHILTDQEKQAEHEYLTNRHGTD